MAFCNTAKEFLDSIASSRRFAMDNLSDLLERKNDLEEQIAILQVKLRKVNVMIDKARESDVVYEKKSAVEKPCPYWNVK